MKLFKYLDDWADALKRPAADVELDVRAIFEQVRAGGDDAVKELTKKIDGKEIKNLHIPAEQIEKAQIGEELQAAIELAARNIEAFHRAQMPRRVEHSENGMECWQEPRAIEKVGLYVPGGSAPLFSTVLMLAIPARLAGCREVVLCTPPNPHPAILWTAKYCGVTKIFGVGGAQAVAAMSLGTESIPQADKIFGPGNRFVMAAKQYAAAHGTAIDMPAGPSEVLVVADSTANPEFVAADLLSQAEHGADSQTILVTWDETLPARVETEIEKQLKTLPRADVAALALDNSRAIVVRGVAEAMAVSNFYAPEHLILAVDDPDALAPQITNAGSVFMGHWSPESAGDYASGTNHTLPTAGWARSCSGVNMDSFFKKITFQRLSREGLARIGSAVQTMAHAEGLSAHSNAVAVRLR